MKMVVVVMMFFFLFRRFYILPNAHFIQPTAAVDRMRSALAAIIIVIVKLKAQQQQRLFDYGCKTNQQQSQSLSCLTS